MKLSFDTFVALVKIERRRAHSALCVAAQRVLCRFYDVSMIDVDTANVYYTQLFT